MNIIVNKSYLYAKYMNIIVNYKNYLYKKINDYWL